MATSTPYDDVFRTLLNDCSKLILPVLNESFDEHYSGHERIVFLPSEHFLSQPGEDVIERITDSCFIVINEDGAPSKKYHIESQATEDGRMLIRIFEYDAQIALDGGEIQGNTLTVTFPHTAVLYLRSTSKTPDEMTIRMVAPSGAELSYNIPVLKVQEYDVEELFQKKLLFLIPFHLFRYAKEFDICERDAVKLQDLKNHYSEIMKRLETLQDSGEIDEFTRRAIIDMTKEVTRHLAEHFTNVKEGVEAIMGGQILNYEAKKIRNKAIAEGLAEGREKGLAEGREKGRAEGRAESLTQVVINMLKEHYPYEIISRLSGTSREEILRIAEKSGLAYE